jgi:23S rRNA pseudouridine1911/1915/1917 synthase
MKLEVLFEDNHCLAVNKPAGLASQGDESRSESLIDVVTRYLRERYRKPGNVYVGLLHRLDRPTSGVLLLAKTSKAASRLSTQFRTGSIAKVYWAVVEGSPIEDEGEWIDRLEKDSRMNRARRLSRGEPGGKEARVAFRVLNRRADFAKLELWPRTGRSHQLRVQLARRGLPILGDTKYGARTRIFASDGRGRIALHARELTFIHPTRGEAIGVVAPVPEDWPEPSTGRSARRSASNKPTAGSGPS